MNPDLNLRSAAFADGKPIPGRFTCDVENVSPPLSWDPAPAGTRSFALICDDPDAPGGTWVHWVLFNLPPGAVELKERVPSSQVLVNGGRHGINDFRRLGYGGPCPPPGPPHRYFFRLFALDVMLELPPGISRRQLDQAAQGHVVATGQITGTYQRQ